MTRTFKTILQIVQDTIAKQAALAGDPVNYQANAHAALERLQRRYAEDPALVLLTNHYAKALMTVLPMLPPEMKTSTMQSVMAQVIQDWEDVHLEYEQQLTPSGG